MKANKYDQKFFAGQKDGAYSSAKQVVPFVVETIKPSSVVDVGCGLGMWLDVFRSNGVIDVTGIDGEYVSKEMLKIPAEDFIFHDLTQPVSLPRTFDLAVSLEVAEHLPQSRAEGFVRDLTQLAPAVLFSAAIPFQGGTGHVNEQWPEYWTDLFRQQDFVPIDCVRPRIWSNGEVESWYKQNTLLYVKASEIGKYSDLDTFGLASGSVQALVHPEMYTCKATMTPQYLGIVGLVRQLTRLLTRKLWNRGDC